MIYRFNPTLINIPVGFSAETDKLILKFIWELKGPRIAKTILKKNKVEGLTLPNFKIIAKLQSSRQWSPGIRIDGQWNRTESPE